LLTGLPGAGLSEWRIHYGATYEQLSRTFAVDGLGAALGSLLGGAVSRCCHGDVSIGVAMVLMAAYPCFHGFLYLTVSAFVFGVAKGLVFVGKTRSAAFRKIFSK
jgi:hypothetical protein